MSRSDKIKLRNKKTGEIKEFDVLGGFMLSDDYPNLYTEDKTYNSLAELNAEWEDYTPAEPLIKDEKIRKAVKAWAEMNGIKIVYVCQTFNAWGVRNKANGNPEDEEYMLADILFRGEKPEELEFGKEYAITELCGEEEE